MNTNYQNNNSFEKEFIEQVVQIKRVSKKTKGGNQIAFTALVVVGDGKGKVGYSLQRAKDVASAIKKAIKKAKESMIEVSLKNGTITHPVQTKFKAARIILKPAKPGTGIIAGGSLRIVANAAGIEDLVSKMMGSKNKSANIRAIFNAFERLKK